MFMGMYEAIAPFPQDEQGLILILLNVQILEADRASRGLWRETRHRGVAQTATIERARAAPLMQTRPQHCGCWWQRTIS